MRLCCNCFEELLDREIICPICNSNTTLDNNQTKEFYCLLGELQGASKLKKKILKKDSKYELAFKYVKYQEEHPKNNNHGYPKILDLARKNDDRESQEEYWNRINQHTINQAELQKLKVKCPYCSSMNTKKISETSKVLNTAIWGVLGTKRFKEWHCNNCNSDF